MFNQPVKMSLSGSVETYILFISLVTLVSACGSGAGSSSGGSGDPRVIWENRNVNIQLLGQIVPNQLNLTLQATVLPPTVAGTVLQADDIYVNGVNAYVSYNLQGNTKLGGIDDLNMTIPVAPIRYASTTFTDTAVNGVYVNGSTVYISGASSSGTVGPSILEQFGLTATSLNTGSFSTVQNTFTPSSFAGTGVTMWNGALYTTSGDSGGLTAVDPGTFAQTASISITDARGLDHYGAGDLWVVAGQPGRVFRYNSANALVRSINLGGASIPESKSTIQMGQSMGIASIGDGGTSIFCQADGNILATMPAPVVNGVSPTLTVTNAATAGPGLLFTANGEAGVYVYLMVSGLPAVGNLCNSVTLTLLGTISLGANYSANNVKYANGNLYVATGLGGFKVITVTLLTAILNGVLDF